MRGNYTTTPLNIKHMSKKGKKTFQTLRGMRDIMPEDWKFYDFVFSEGKRSANDYGYQRIETPMLEYADLFKRTAGHESDIVTKEMYDFEDKGGDHIVVRPELTAPISRAYIEHGMPNQPHPVKLWYWMSAMRYERPQAGRYRQFTHLGYEVYGDAVPVTDAEMMIMGYRMLEAWGIPVTVHVNSLGDKESRTAYKRALTSFLKPKLKEFAEEDRERYKKNILRILDSKDKEMQKMLEDAPQMIDYLSDESREYLLKIVDYLDDLNIPYELDSKLVRGLDYYTGTVFEFIPNACEIESPEGKKREIPGGRLSVGGGGRYDDLIQELGGKQTPAIGMSFGVERILLHLKERRLQVPDSEKPQVFVGQIGEDARKRSLALFEELRSKGIRVSSLFSKEGIKSQLDMANKTGVRYALILGQKELLDNTILIRDMENGIQETVDLGKAVSEIMKRLKTVS